VPRSLTLLPVVLLCAACTRLPESYPPPAQRRPLTQPSPTGFGYFVYMSDPNAGAYLVQDFTGDPGTPRWAHSHPVFRFFVPAAPRLRFSMEFAIPERTFRETGPVTLTFRANNTIFDRQRYDSPGQLRYLHEVPPALLRPDAVNLIAIDPDPVWVSKEDGDRLGFIVSKAGFTE